jgi:hypothetical protein
MAVPQWKASPLPAPSDGHCVLEAGLVAEDSKGKSSVKVTNTLTTPEVNVRDYS